MQEKYEVGDVGQLVTGGTVNEGSKTHLNNILNLSLGGKEARPITDLQRKAISNKVNDVLAVTGLARLDVYKVILTDCGVDKIAELPRDAYHEVMAMLEGWIREATGEDAPPPAPIAASAMTSDLAPANHHATADCHCGNGVGGQLARTRYMIGLVGVAVTTAMVGSAWVLAPGQQGVAPALCHFDGRVYSVGSVVTMDGRKRECQITTNSAGPGWVTGAVLH